MISRVWHDMARCAGLHAVHCALTTTY
eukprot:COSAG01_NODE_69756_length_264_cov_0.968944_1_plen_26_part_10